MKILYCILFLLLVIFSWPQSSISQTEFSWKPYSKQAVEDSMAQNKPMVIDFYAQWCPVCHELDRTIFSLPEIQAKLSRVTALRVDMTNQYDPEVQRIAQALDIEGVPTIIFVDSKGQEINNTRIIGFATPEDFAQTLDSLRK